MCQECYQRTEKTLDFEVEWWDLHSNVFQGVAAVAVPENTPPLRHQRFLRFQSHRLHRCQEQDGSAETQRPSLSTVVVSALHLLFH